MRGREGGEGIKKSAITYSVVLESSERSMIRSLEDLMIQKIVRDHSTERYGERGGSCARFSLDTTA